MKTRAFLSRLSHSSISFLAIVTLIALACSIQGFCGEIHNAARRGDLQKVKSLLTENPELISSKWYGSMPLHEAAANGHKDVVELLLAKGADVNAKDRNASATPLFWGVWSGNKDVVVLLLANNANANAKNENGWTPLHKAAQCGRKDMAELLLVKGADVNTKDNKGETPLHQAAAHSSKEVAELLLAKGADVNARNINGETPLHVAMRGEYKKMDVAKLLLANKADANAKDNNGLTSLHWAALICNGDIIEILLANKAEVNAKTNDGKTPLDMTSLRFRNDVIKLLLANKAEYSTGAPETRPKLLICPSPPYTEEARKANVNGIVFIQATLRKDGTFTNLKMLKGLGYGLDESIINTITTKWRCEPATKSGVPIDQTIYIEIRFRN
jgi:TonB family protein